MSEQPKFIGAVPPTHYAHERSARIMWSVIAEPGDAVAQTLVAHFGGSDAMRVVLDRKATEVTGPLPASLTTARGQAMLTTALDRFHERLTDDLLLDPHARITEGVRVLIPGDEEWPERLYDLGQAAPFCLYVKGGHLGRLTHDSVTITGARASTPYGEHVAAQLATDLAQGGANGHERKRTVVGGLSFGIEAAAHRAALAVGGLSVAVLPRGIDGFYPVAHQALGERIVKDGGALVTELPPGAGPTRWRTLERHRLMAALSEGTVLVEAGFRSGSLSVVTRAHGLSRPFGAVPGPVTSATSAGPHRVMRELQAKVITEAADVFDMLDTSS